MTSHEKLIIPIPFCFVDNNRLMWIDFGIEMIDFQVPSGDTYTLYTSAKKLEEVAGGWEVVVVAGGIEKETGESGVGRTPPLSLYLSLPFIYFSVFFLCLLYTN